jgi:hypothetical protein
MKGALFHCLGYPRHQRPQFEGLFVHAAMSGTFRRRKVRIPEVYLGKENIGLQIGFVVDDRKDESQMGPRLVAARRRSVWHGSNACPMCCETWSTDGP